MKWVLGMSSLFLLSPELIFSVKLFKLLPCWPILLAIGGFGDPILLYVVLYLETRYPV